jgi:molybdopterin molybdotransferase
VCATPPRASDGRASGQPHWPSFAFTQPADRAKGAARLPRRPLCSPVGARDETAGAEAALGDIWCHGLAIKPGKPTLLAECAGVPVVGLPGNPLSALVVFRLVGVPLV